MGMGLRWRTTWTRRIVTAAAALLLVPGISSAAFAAYVGETWQSPASTGYTSPNLSDPSVDAGIAEVAVSGNTSIVVFSRESGANSIIQTVRSTDGGATWSSPVTISADGGNVNDPQIAFNGSTAIAVWNRGTGVAGSSVVQTARSTDGGATWGAPLDLSAAGRDAGSQQVTFSGSTAVILWDRWNGTNWFIQSSRSTDGGATWSTPGDVSSVGSDGESPVVSASGSTVIAVWRQTSGGVAIITTARSIDGGATWSAPTALSGAGTAATAHSVALNGSLAVVAWVRSNGISNITQARSSTDGGVTWGLVADLSVSGQTSLGTDVTISNGVAIVIWQRLNGSNSMIKSSRSTDGGATWSAVLDMSPSGGDTRYPRVSSSGGTVIAVWQSYSGSTSVTQVVTSTDAGATWGGTATLSQPGATAFGTRIALSGSTAVSVWIRGVFGVGPDILQVAYSNLPPGPPGTAQFTYWLDDGRECTSISPQTVAVGASVALPDASALCGHDGSVVAGWRIPGQPSAFPPGFPVTVVAPQQFTAVLTMPWIRVVSDANVSNGDRCMKADGQNTDASERISTQWIPRDKVTAQPLPPTAPCTPPGRTLAGWTTRGDAVLALGGRLPSVGVDPDGNPGNSLHLYAMWK